MMSHFIQSPPLIPTICCLVAMAGCMNTAKSDVADATAGRQDAVKSDAADAEVVLFRKPLDGGRQLVVLRGPRHPMADVAPPVMSDNNFKHVPDKGYFVVSLQVLPAHGPALTLASKLVPVLADVPSLGFDVFDVLIDDGLIVIAVGAWGIDLWQVIPYGDPREKWVVPKERKPQLPQVRITALPAYYAPISRGPTFAYPDRKSFSVKLSLTGDGHVQADVVDLESADKWHRRFVQVGDEWEFKGEEKKR
jgi:hypothetical protein